MPRGPNEKALEAQKLYKGGMKLKDIAKKLDKPEGTIRRWKSTYGWDKENERSDKKANVRKQNEGSKKEAIADEVDSVLKNTKLTDKQRLFCLHFVKCFNATKAYQKAYKCEYSTAAGQGYAMLKNAEIKKEIDRLKQEKMNQVFLSESDIFQKYMDIAFADISDFVMFGNEDIEFTDDSGNKRTATISHVNVRNDSEVDGTLITEVSKGKDGVKVKLADRMKALDWLAAHMDLATPEQKAKVELLNAQKDKLNGTDNDDSDEHITIVNDIKDLNEQ